MKATTLPRVHPELNEFGSYEIRWSELRDGVWRSRRKSCKTSDQAEAEKALARFLLDRQRLEPQSRTTVADIFDAYEEEWLKPRDLLSGTGHLLRAPRLAFGGRDPLSIAQEDIDAFVRDRCAGKYAPTYRPTATVKPRKLQPQSAAREVTAMQAALNWGSTKRRMVFGKPTFKFDRPAVQSVRDLWLTEDQERDLKSKLHLASRSVQLFALMGLTYAARRTAMMDLKFGPQVKFISDTIDFNVPGARITRKRRAQVPMTPEIREHLEVLFKERGAGAYVLDRYTYRHFAEFVDGIGYGWVTPHTLKHTAITLMLRSNAGRGDPMWPAKVGKATATSLQTIMSVYWHHVAAENLSIFTARRG